VGIPGVRPIYRVAAGRAVFADDRGPPLEPRRIIHERILVVAQHLGDDRFNLVRIKNPKPSGNELVMIIADNVRIIIIGISLAVVGINEERKRNLTLITDEEQVFGPDRPGSVGLDNVVPDTCRIRTADLGERDDLRLVTFLGFPFGQGF
jgi:hypothetical protein